MAERIKITIDGDSKDLQSACTSAIGAIKGVEGATKDSTSATREHTKATKDHTSATRDHTRANKELKSSLINVAAGAQVAKDALAFVKLPAMIAGAGELGAAIEQLGAGFTTMASAVGPASGAMVALPSILSAGAEGMLTFKLAMGGVSEALKGNQKAFEKLTPEAKSFVNTLKSYKPELDSLRRDAQKGLFPGLEKGLTSAHKNFNVLRTMIGDTGKTMGGLAAEAGKLIGSKGFGKDLLKINSTNQRSLKDLGGAFIDLGSATRHVLVAADPFMKWLTGLGKQWGKSINGAAALGRQNGSLAKFLDHTRESMTVMGHVTNNLGVSLFNMGKAGRKSGMDLWTMLDGTTKKWRAWTASTEGQNRMKEHFEKTKPAMIEAGRLLQDVAKDFVKLGEGSNLGPLIAQVRTQLLPAVFELVNGTAKSLGPKLVDTLTQIARMFSQLGGSSGPLAKMVEFVGAAAKNAADFLKKHQDIRNILVWVIAAGGIYKIFKLGSAISAAKSLYDWLGKAAALKAPSMAPGTVPTGAPGSSGKPGGTPPVVPVGAPGKPTIANRAARVGRGILRGAGVWAVGETASDLIGNAVGGGLGNQISNVGTWAARGAGAGATVGGLPGGLIGGAAGGAFGAIPIVANAGAGLANVGNNVARGVGAGAGGFASVMGPALAGNYILQVKKARDGGKTIIAGMTKDLQSLDVDSRTLMGQTILNMADEMVKKKQLTKSAADKIKAGVLTALFGMQTGATTSANTMLANVTDALNGIADNASTILRSLGVTDTVGNRAAARKSAGAVGNVLGLPGVGGQAVGGYVGRAGAAGRDTVPTLLGEGEAVLNRHQQPIVDAALRAVGVGGLNGLFASVNRPHYMARGGIRKMAGGGNVSGDTDVTPGLLNALRSMSAATNHSIYIRSGRRSLGEQAALYARYKAGRGPIAAPPNANAPHVLGIAADISPGREVFGGVAGRYGLGFTVPSESWHIQLGGSGGGGGGGRVKPPRPHLKHPQIGGAGWLHQAGQGAIDKVWSGGQGKINDKWGAMARGGFVRMARGGRLNELAANITNFTRAIYEGEFASTRYSSDDSYYSGANSITSPSAANRLKQLRTLIADQRQVYRWSEAAYRNALNGLRNISYFGKHNPKNKKDRDRLAKLKESGPDFRRTVASNPKRSAYFQLQQLIAEQKKISKFPELYNQDTSGLLALLQSQNQQYANAAFGIGNQMDVLGGFGSALGGRFVGSFAHGGPIAQTGMALVHRGEYIVPDPRGAYKAQAVAQTPQIAIHVHGDAGPIIDRITAEVDGRVARVVSEESGRRARVLATGTPRARSAYGGLTR